MDERTCAIDGCTSPVLARGWCRKHYERWSKHGDPLKLLPRGGGVLLAPIAAREDATGLRTCKTCGEEKPLEDYQEAPRYRGGRLPHCSACAPAIRAAQHAKRVARSAGRHSKQWRDSYLRRKYGLTTAEYEARVASQEGRCPGCRRDDRPLVVDHDHGTNVVRDLLCNDCNLALGHVHDDPAVLLALADYLSKHRAAYP